MTQVPANQALRTGWAPMYVPPAVRCVAELLVTIVTVWSHCHCTHPHLTHVSAPNGK